MKVVFFDGECLLCTGMVRWAHRCDRDEVLWFAALNSDFAEKKREELPLPPAGKESDTFAFWDESKGSKGVSCRSDGVLALLRTLGGFWAGLGVLLGVFPRGMRDALYSLIACNRRKWFGESKECSLPPASLRGRVLS